MAARHNWEFRNKLEARKAASSYYNAGLRDYKTGNIKRAIKWWKLAYKVEWIDENNSIQTVGSPNAALALGKLSFHKHDFTAAVLHFEWAHELGSSEALIYLAKIALVKKNKSKAMKLLLQAYKEGRQDALILYKQLSESTREDGAL